MTENKLEGKICLITGGTSGIGRETALGLAKLGLEIIIVGRDRTRTVETVRSLIRHSGNQKIDFLLADLSELHQVRDLATDFKSRHNRLDILVNNAGAIFTKEEVTSEKIEKTWALNHLSPLFLTLELKEVLKAGSPSRVVNVTSAMYADGDMNSDNIQIKTKYSGIMAYNNSKLAMVLTTFALAKRLKDDGMTVNCVHPGLVSTGIGTNNKGFYGWLIRLSTPLKWFLTATSSYMILQAEGAKTSIYLSSSSEVSSITGKYFYKNKEKPTNKKTLDENFQDKVWNLSLTQINKALCK